jgi:20S proteasome alpha/beta subunit
LDSSVLAVAGKDFVVVGGDTRMSYGYSIASRNVTKMAQL